MMDQEPTIGLNLAPGVFAQPGAMRMQFSRAGGPGGQNVNKLNTRAELWVILSGIRGVNAGAMARLMEMAGQYLTDAGEIHIASNVHRTQERNRQEALDKLRELIVRAKVVPKRRRATRPSAGSKRRRLEAKRHRGEIKARRGEAGEST